MNGAHFGGRVGSDADLKYTPSGTAIAKFSMALDNGKDKEGEKKSPTWVKVEIWAERAEKLAQYITKGKYVTVYGPVSVEAWKTKDGEARAQLVITCREFEFGGGPSKESESTDQQRQPQQQSDRWNPEITDEDIPF